MALATIGVVAVAMVGLSAVRSPSSGAPTREEAVAVYIGALNRRDAGTLRVDGHEGAALEAGIRRRLDEFGGRDIRLSGQEVLDGVTPYHSYIVVTGTMVDQNGRDQTYQERLFLRGDDGRWFVDLREPLSPTASPPLPPAGVTQPT